MGSTIDGDVAFAPVDLLHFIDPVQFLDFIAVSESHSALFEFPLSNMALSNSHAKRR
jgi:hypothetical protein